MFFSRFWFLYWEEWRSNFQIELSNIKRVSNHNGQMNTLVRLINNLIPQWAIEHIGSIQKIFGTVANWTHWGLDSQNVLKRRNKLVRKKQVDWSIRSMQ